MRWPSISIFTLIIFLFFSSCNSFKCEPEYQFYSLPDDILAYCSLTEGTTFVYSDSTYSFYDTLVLVKKTGSNSPSPRDYAELEPALCPSVVEDNGAFTYSFEASRSRSFRLAIGCNNHCQTINFSIPSFDYLGCGGIKWIRNAGDWTTGFIIDSIQGVDSVYHNVLQSEGINCHISNIKMHKQVGIISYRAGKNPENGDVGGYYFLIDKF